MLLCYPEVNAQNQSLETIELTGIDRIIINGNEIFEIEIYSENRRSLQMTTLLDGEYENDFQFTSSKKNGSLEIQLVESDFSKIIDDKRNAHKVVAATLKLVVPKNQNVEVVSDVGFLIAKGDFSSLKVSLRSGFFRYQGETTYLRAETVEGDITVHTQNAEVEAYSANGNSSISPGIQGKNKVFLKSLRGNILVESMAN